MKFYTPNYYGTIIEVKGRYGLVRVEPDQDDTVTGDLWFPLSRAFDVEIEVGKRVRFVAFHYHAGRPPAVRAMWKAVQTKPAPLSPSQLARLQGRPAPTPAVVKVEKVEPVVMADPIVEKVEHVPVLDLDETDGRNSYPAKRKKRTA